MNVNFRSEAKAMWKKENSNLDETWWYVEKLGNFLYPLNTYLLNQTINFLLELSRSDKNIHDHLFIRILRLIHVELVNIKSWKIFVVGIIGIYESYEFHIIGFFFSLGWVHKYDLHVRFYVLKACQKYGSSRCRGAHPKIEDVTFPLNLQDLYV